MNRLLAVPISLLTATAHVAPGQDGDPLTELRAWLAKPADSRAKLGSQPFSKVALSKEQAEQTRDLLWKDTVARLRHEREDEFEARKLTYRQREMKFDFRTFGKAPRGGHSLFISMHGGGGAPPRLNDRQWRNQIRLYQPEEGYYVAPRAPSNTWDLWHQSHIDPLFDRLIEDFVLLKGVNPNRVYLMGYSAGGDGVFQVAPRMSDRFAAAAMMAGHPNETKPTGLRNLPFTLHVGEKDGGYKRNKVAADWKKKLASLREKDPKGYVHHVRIHQGKGHWMDRQDAVALPWMAKFTRNPWPKKVVWLQDNVTHTRFYWLSLAEEDAHSRQLIEASVQGQVITISLKKKPPAKLILRLSDALLDLDEPVHVRIDQQIVFMGKVTRSIGVIAKSLAERLDPESAAFALVPLKIPTKPAP